MNFDLHTFISENSESLHEIIDLIPIPLFIKDINGKYLAFNRTYELHLGISKEDMIGKTVHDLWPKKQADQFTTKDKELFDFPGIQKYQSDITSSLGKQCVVEFHKSTFKNSEGQIIGLLGAVFDITEKVNLENKLKKLASIIDSTK